MIKSSAFLKKKLNKCFFTSASAAQAASFRKMILAMTKDLRVILIKLADRIHNVRTLQYKPIEKQKNTARETLEIYAPLAHRLGIYKFKSEFEERCFKILQPEKTAEIEKFSPCSSHSLLTARCAASL